jgi:hypothetical protein
MDLLRLRVELTLHWDWWGRRDYPKCGEVVHRYECQRRGHHRPPHMYRTKTETVTWT